MTNAKRALTTALLFIAIGTGIGCATSSGAPRDLRSSAQVAGAGPSLLVAGPALLMHVDVDHARGPVVVYAVERKQGTSADCGAGPSGDTVRLHSGRPNPVNLVIPADQAACISSPGAEASVRWHARRVQPGADGGIGSLLALRARAASDADDR